MVNNISIEDLNEFNRLGTYINANFVNLFSLSDLIDSKYDYLFGYYNDKLIGFIHVNKLYENMDIVNIVVDPSYRRKGIANELLNYCLNYFNDLESVMLEVNENNISAIKLYEKNGFKEINKREKYYGDDTAIIMKRDV